MTASSHPAGLRTLFVTEMWERFSYYGMRALLVLFMVDAIQQGGLGLTDEVATAIFGLYTAGVYLAALPGGWIADRFLGARRCVWYGGLIIAAGHFTLAIPGPTTFYSGLVLVVAGTGLLKPNISVMVGRLYRDDDARRDAGFTLFYMGINLGAALGPLVCSTLGEKWNWHYGFGAAGVGMLLGLLQFRLARGTLDPTGSDDRPASRPTRPERVFLCAGLLAIIALLAVAFTGTVRFNPVRLARGTTTLIVAVAAVYFVYAFFFLGLDAREKRRVGVIGILFVASALFWSGFEQAGSSFNLFAERYTLRDLAFLNFEIPAGWFQSLGPVFIILLAPVMAALWVSLARRQREPSIPVKFAAGLILLGLGFLVMAGAARIVASGDKVWPTWLITTYLLHTFGELCISPVGLSSVTRLAPERLTGQMMGIWFLATSLGNLIAGLVAGEFRADALREMPALYLQIVIPPVLAGVLLLVFARPIRRWSSGSG